MWTIKIQTLKKEWISVYKSFTVSVAVNPLKPLELILPETNKTSSFFNGKKPQFFRRLLFNQGVKIHKKRLIKQSSLISDFRSFSYKLTNINSYKNQCYIIHWISIFIRLIRLFLLKLTINMWEVCCRHLYPIDKALDGLLLS